LPVKGTVRAYSRQTIALAGAVRPGRYVATVVLRAVTNPARTTTITSRPFSVAARAVR
jgi:hypothetical protein